MNSEDFGNPQDANQSLLSFTPGPEDEAKLQHIKRPLPNFKFIEETESVGSKLKVLSDYYTELISPLEMKKIMQSITNVITVKELKNLEKASEEGTVQLESDEEKKEQMIIKVDMASEKNGLNAKSVTELKFENRQSLGSLRGYQKKINRKSVLDAIAHKTNEMIRSKTWFVQLILCVLILAFSLTLRFLITHETQTLGLHSDSLAYVDVIQQPIGCLYKEVNKLWLI